MPIEFEGTDIKEANGLNICRQCPIGYHLVDSYYDIKAFEPEFSFAWSDNSGNYIYNSANKQKLNAGKN